MKQHVNLFLYLGFSFLLLLSCANNSESSNELLDLAKKSTDYSKGKKLMENKCYVCHNPKLKEDELIAPPMIAIKEAYHFDNEEEFTQAFKAWLNNPNPSRSLMPEAVKKYGVMPYQAYNEETILAIASYLYNNEIERPSWWENEPDYEQTSENNTEEQLSVLDLGVSFALQTKQALGKNLMHKLTNEGTAGAIDFCTVHALPITDSMSNQLGVTIQRVTNKPRNPLNKANAFEEELIKSYQEVLNKKQEPEAFENLTSSGQSIVYYPIETNNMCLQCHGVANKTLKKETHDLLKKHYPQDQAIGYGTNEVRGIWKVTFPKN
jgi:nitrate reductase cytochrome c-type subunit